MTNKEIIMQQEIAEAEAKDKLVLEYLNLSCEFTDSITHWRRKAEIKDRINQIRDQLGMDKI